MWPLTIRIIELLIVVIVFSQVIYPVLADKPLFWLFRKTKHEPAPEKRSFDEEVEYLKQSKEQAATLKAKSEAEIAARAGKIDELKN